MADVVGPGGAAVGLAGKGVRLGRGLGRPAAAEAGGGERPKVSAVGPDGLDDHEVLGVAGAALHGVDLHGLEQVVGGVGQHGLVVGPKAAGEVADGHAGAVDLAIVSGKEQVHVGAVADDGLVDGAGAGAGDLAREERLGRRPAVGVGRVAGRLVGKRGGPPLVGQNPHVLGTVEEERRGHGGLGHGGLGRRAHLVEVVKEPERERAPFRALVVVRGVNQVPAIVVGVGEVLERSPAVLGLSQRP